MPVSDEELAELQTAVEAKRQTLTETQAEREAAERALSNDITAAQLMAESARLDAQIAQQQGMLANVGLQGNSVMESAKEAMELAVKQQEGQAALEAAQTEAKTAAEAQAVADAEAVAAAQAANAEAEAAALAAAEAAAATTTTEGSGQ